MDTIHDACVSLPGPVLRLSGRSSPVWAVVQEVTARGLPSSTPTAVASPPHLLNSCRGPGKGQAAEGFLPPGRLDWLRSSITGWLFHHGRRTGVLQHCAAAAGLLERVRPGLSQAVKPGN